MTARGSARIVATLAGALVSIGAAQAHVRLLQPPPALIEDAQGDPQKNAPCGGPGTPTGVVTTFRAGETITVKWQETIYHPGHFRLALASDRAQLVDPTVTSDGAGNSLTATIEDPPSAPVLLDGLYPRTGSGASGRLFEQQLTLPSTPCASCTLQLIQFMAGHAAPYLYHHCADVEIVEASGGCRVVDGRAATTTSLLVCLALLALSRRRATGACRAA